MKNLLKIVATFIYLFVIQYGIAQKGTTSVETKKQLEEIKRQLEKDIKTTEKKIAELENSKDDSEKIAPTKNNASKKQTTKKKKETEKEVSTDTIAPDAKTTGKILTGVASFYSAKFEGRKTANGETFRQSKLTCACNRLPLGTWLKITNLKNNKTIIVRVNDRMAPHMKRLVDLTLTGAKKLDFVASGLTQVKAEVIKKK